MNGDNDDAITISLVQSRCCYSAAMKYSKLKLKKTIQKLT